MTSVTQLTPSKTNQDYTKAAMGYTSPKEMTDHQRTFHQNVRDFLRESIEYVGAESLNKATTEQITEAIQRVMVSVKGGVFGETKISIAEKVMVCAWSLRAELKKLADAAEITMGRSIEKHVIDGFDFEAHSTTKKAKAEPKSNAIAPKTGPVATLPEGTIEREDLLPQLLFHGADSPDRVSELLEAWNMGGDFRLMVRRNQATGKVVKSLNEQDDRQTLCLFDAEGKRIGMAYMDKLTQYFTVIELN
jgi:hypothetical protein